MAFLNRVDAGRQLAATLHAEELARPVVVGLTMGGVAVAAEVARELRTPLEICVVGRLIAPGDPPLAIGAVAEGGARYLNEARLAARRLPPDEVDRLVARALAEVTRLAGLLRDAPPIDLHGRDVILVDDGMVTGGSVRAAVPSVRARGAAQIVLAIPVANREAIASVRPEVDRVVCLISDPLLVAIGARYARFLPVSEAEVVDLLAASRPGPGDVLAIAAPVL